MNSPVIRFENVSRSFGSQIALQDVSFEVAPGTVFAMLGENGAGKTTSIKTMLGMCEPHAGSVQVLGMHPQQRSLEIRRQIGYVPEQASLYEWMTVAEAGWFAAGFYPPGFQQEYNRLITNFGLQAGQKLKSLSKGMRAKVVLALAMAHQPPLLILDEPTSGLDTLVRREFLESMVDLTAAGQTVFLSSHQIPEVERVADVVVIMKQGKILVNDQLTNIKDFSREVIVTFENQVNPTLIPGHIIDHRVQGRQCVAMIRTDDEQQFYRLQERDDVRTIDIRRPSLEDIFVAYMHGAAVTPTHPNAHISQEASR